jgi:hypothetical protein
MVPGADGWLGSETSITLILMGVWCGAHMADTTRKKTGMRLRPHVGRECARWNATEKSRQKLRQGEVLSLDRSLLMGVSKTEQMHDLVLGLFINRYEFGRAI